jgi:hypothetical protein
MSTKKKIFKKPAPGSTPMSSPVSDEERRSNLLRTAMNKLVSLNAALKDLGIEPEQAFKMSDRNNDKKLTVVEFQALIANSKAQMNPSEVMCLFEYLDADKDEFVTQLEFIEKLKEETQKNEDSKANAMSANSNVQPPAPAKNMPLAPPVRSQDKKPTMKENYQKMNMTEEEVQREFENYMEKVKIDPKSDFFLGKKTIINDPLKALKRCLEIVASIKQKKSGRMLFDDEEFGPNINDPFGFDSISFDPPYRGAPNKEDVAWCRLIEISPNAPPEFLFEGATSNDVNQGALGDCWFIGAMSILSSDDRYIRGNFKPDMSKPTEVTKIESNGMMTGVYPPIFHQFRKYGIYVLRFFKNFQWRYVIIDDKLPCYKGSGVPELIFASCSAENEFWVPLFEKAYAKLHKNYQALFSGDISDALVDFTGLVSEKLVIQDRGAFNSKVLKSKDELWKKLAELKKRGTLMGCSIVGTGIEHAVMLDGEDTGLISGHAYSIQSVIEFKDSSGQNQRLIRIRNPWGGKNLKEWTGAWCDASEEMIMNYELINQKIKEADKNEAELIDLDEKKRADGNFFMSYEDFVRIWCKLSVCHKFPTDYKAVRYVGNWDKQTAGGTPYRGLPEQVQSWTKNTQYLLKVSQKTHVFVSLGQEDGRLKASATEAFPFTSCIHPVVIVVLKSTGDSKAQFNGGAIAGMSPIKQFKEVSLDVILEPGSYVVVPSTQDIGQQGTYYLNIYHGPGQVEIKDLTTGKAPDVIVDEDEAYYQKVDPELSKFLKLKSAETIFN